MGAVAEPFVVAGAATGAVSGSVAEVGDKPGARNWLRLKSPF